MGLKVLSNLDGPSAKATLKSITLTEGDSCVDITAENYQCLLDGAGSYCKYVAIIDATSCSGSSDACAHKCGDIAIGPNSNAGGDVSGGNIAIGNGANTNGEYGAIAMGLSAESSEYCTMALGPRTHATGEASISIGAETRSTCAYSMGVGYMNSVNAPYASAFGPEARVGPKGTNGIAIGYCATVAGSCYDDVACVVKEYYGEDAIAIGTSAHTGCSNAIAIGGIAWAKEAGNVAIGYCANGAGRGTVVVGGGAQSFGSQNTLIGASSCSHGSDGTAVGFNSTVFGQAAIAIGCSAKAGDNNKDGSIAIGGMANSTGCFGIAIGQYANTCNKNRSIAIGAYTRTDDYDNIAIGYCAEGGCSSTQYFSGEGNIVIGANAKTYGRRSTVIGEGAQFRGRDDGSVIIGSSACGLGFCSVAIGQGANVNDFSTALGSETYASNGSISIGARTYSTDLATAIGLNANAKFCGVAIGNIAKSTGESSIAIGAGACSDKDHSIVLNATADSNSGWVCPAACNTFNVFTGGGYEGFYVDGTKITDTFASKSHSHAISDVTNLQTTLNGKAASSHTHTIANVTGLQSALNAKQCTLTAGDNITISGNVISATHLCGYTSEEDTALGINAFACSGEFSQATAIGANSKSGPFSVAVGSYACAGRSSVAIGCNAHTGTSIESTALGPNAQAEAGQSIAIGMCTSISSGASGSIAIGEYASVESSHIGSIAIGPYSDIQAACSIAIGLASHAASISSIAIGCSAQVDGGGNSIAIGPLAGFCIANHSAVTSGNSVMIGSNALAFYCGISIGSNAYANDRNISIGAGSMANSANSYYPSNGAVVIGTDATLRQSDTDCADAAVVIGDKACGSGHSVAIGATSTTIGYCAIAIGSQYPTAAKRNIAIGAGAKATFEGTPGDNSVVIGTDAYTSYKNSIVIGDCSKSGPNTVAVGNSISNDKGADFGHSVIVGSHAKVIGYCNIVIGCTAEARCSNSIAIGAKAIAESYKPDGKVPYTAMAIGNNTYAGSGIAIGYMASAGSNGHYCEPSIAIGNFDQYSMYPKPGMAPNNVILGNYIQAYSTTQNYDGCNVIIGNNAKAFGNNLTSVGNMAAVGYCMDSTGYNSGSYYRSSAFGANSTTSGSYTTSIGANSISIGCASMAIGVGAYARTANSTSLYAGKGPGLKHDNYAVRFTQIAGDTTDTTYYIFQHMHVTGNDYPNLTDNRTGVKISATSFFNMLKQFGGTDYDVDPIDVDVPD